MGTQLEKTFTPRPPPPHRVIPLHMSSGPPPWLFANNSSNPPANPPNTAQSQPGANEFDTMAKKTDSKESKKAAATASAPSAELIGLVEGFLTQYASSAATAFTKQVEKNGWARATPTGAASLEGVVKSWQDSNSGAKVTDIDMKDASSDSSSSSSSSSDSDADSESEGDQKKKQKKKAPVKKTLKRKASSSPSESSDSESEQEAKPKSKKQKKKQESSSSSSSSDSSSSSSSSSSDSSEEEKPVKAKDAAKVALPESDSDSSSASSSSSSSSDSSSSSESSSGSSSDSDSSDSDSSSESSSSDSDSSSGKKKKTTKKQPKVQKTVTKTVKKVDEPATDKISTASSVTVDTASASEDPPLPPDPVELKKKKQNERFSRIPKNIKVDEKFADNSWAHVDYSKRAHEDLIVTKGKGFTKEKNKKKKGSFKGGLIDISHKGAVYFDD